MNCLMPVALTSTRTGAPLPDSEPAPAPAKEPSSAEPIVGTPAKELPRPEPVLAKNEGIVEIQGPRPPQEEAVLVPVQNGSVRLGAPVFERADGVWQVRFPIDGPVQLDSFRLQRPPRLALDIKRADLDTHLGAHPAQPPQLARVRIGKRGQGLRLVLDFKGIKVPRYEIETLPDAIQVRLP